jgi:hypothetical protein
MWGLPAQSAGMNPHLSCNKAKVTLREFFEHYDTAGIAAAGA